MENLLGNEIVVGKVVRAEIFDGSRKPEMFKLWIDLGEEVVQRAAQLGYNYTVKDVEGLKLLCLTDLGEVRISSFKY